MLLSIGMLLLWSFQRSEGAEIVNVTVSNWTSCEDFLKGTHFDASKVIDIDWKIFYFWNIDFEESYIVRFHRVSPTLLDRFRIELDDDMKPPVNWSNAEMFMETTIDYSALFIRTNVSGRYRLIPSVSFQLRHELNEEMIFALKLVKPGYLGIENCKLRLCYALAPINKMPKVDELQTAASKIGYWNEFGHSYVYRRTIISRSSTIAPMTDPDDFELSPIDDHDDDDMKEKRPTIENI